MGRKWHYCGCAYVFVCGFRVCVCVLQPEKQEDGTVTGKDRWRQKLLSAMAAGMPVTPPLLSLLLPFLSSLAPPPLPYISSSLLLLIFLLPLPVLCFPTGCSLSVLLFLSHPLASTVLTIQVYVLAHFCAFLGQYRQLIVTATKLFIFSSLFVELKA